MLNVTQGGPCTGVSVSDYGARGSEWRGTHHALRWEQEVVLVAHRHPWSLKAGEGDDSDEYDGEDIILTAV